MELIFHLLHVSLAITDLPAFTHPRGTEFLWAFAFGIGAAVLGTSAQRLAVFARQSCRNAAPHSDAHGGVGHCGVGDNLQPGGGECPCRCSVFRRGPFAPSDPQRGHLLGGSNPALDCLQGPGLQHLAQLLSWRSRFPRHVHRSGGGHLTLHLPGLSVTAGIAMGIGAMTVRTFSALPMTAVLLPSLMLRPRRRRNAAGHCCSGCGLCGCRSRSG